MLVGSSVFRVLIDPGNSKQQGCNTLTIGIIPAGTSGGWPVLLWGHLLLRALPLPYTLVWLEGWGSGLFLRLFREEVPLTWGVCQAFEL